MWKKTVIFSLLVIAISVHFRNEAPMQIPKMPNTYWGPGKPVEDPPEVLPFKIDVSKEAIEDLNQRLDRTRQLVPPLEDVNWTYGISSNYLKIVQNYWRNKYDWSKRQNLLNKYPQFTTKIQGLDIHFYRVKPTLPKDRKIKVLPLLMVHGWPGSIVEFQKIIPLLVTPKPDKDYVFELIIPSLPGYGFSKPAVRPGLGPSQISVIFKNLMLKLGFEKFYTQGGDWGSVVTSDLAALFPQHVIGTHLNMCLSMSPKSFLWSLVGTIFPSLIVDEKYRSRMYPLSKHFGNLIEETGYMHIQATKPDTVGTGLSDSPMGLAAYILEKFSVWTNSDYKNREDGGLTEKFTIDELLDNVMVYWVTNSIVTSQRLYAENFSKETREAGYNKIPVQVPVGCAMFPHELFYQPESVLKDRYPNIIHASYPPRGGHFAALEEPQLLADDVWNFVEKVEHKVADKKR